METPNAFIDHPTQPTLSEIESALGPAADLWHQLIGWVEKQGVAEKQWKSISHKYGWSLRLKRRNRTILYIGPCAGCFRVAFVLGDRAVEAARESDLPPRVIEAIETATRYAEGTGVAFFVRQESDLGAIMKLVNIKLAN
ncbi:MAG: DUF3788 domain-containing protein [Terracidiphilus sp.]